MFYIDLMFIKTADTIISVYTEVFRVFKLSWKIHRTSNMHTLVHMHSIIHTTLSCAPRNVYKLLAKKVADVCL